jgi:hypothetical protein
LDRRALRAHRATAHDAQLTGHPPTAGLGAVQCAAYWSPIRSGSTRAPFWPSLCPRSWPRWCCGC